MGNAEDLKTLGEDMCRAFEERKETISNIRKEVSELKSEAVALVGEFSKEREATGAAWAEVVSAMRGKRGAPGKPHKKSRRTAEV